MQRTFKFYFLKIKRLFTSANNTPESMAKGIALGIFVGLTPSVGFQMLPVFLLAILFSGNRILALIFTYVSNPVTVIPLYGLHYYLGSLLWPNLNSVNFSRIKDVLVNFSFSKLTQLGFESFVILWTGGFVIAIPSSIISYFVFYRIILIFRKKKELRLKLKKKFLHTIPIIKSRDMSQSIKPDLDIPRQGVAKKKNNIN